MASKRTAKRKRQRIARRLRTRQPRTPIYLRDLNRIAKAFYTPEKIAAMISMDDALYSNISGRSYTYAIRTNKR